MNKKQENKRRMYIAIQTHCLENQNIWVNYIPFNDAFTEMSGIMEKIEYYNELKIKPTIGVAQDKQEERAMLEKKLLLLCGKASAYAASKANQTLKETFNYTKTKLKGQRDSALLNIVSSVTNSLSAILTDLADYNVNPAMLTDLQQSANNFKQILSQPRNKIIARKGATTQLATLFKQVDFIIKEILDKLVLNFIDSHKDFVMNYQNARITVDLKRHRRNNNPIPPETNHADIVI